MINETDKDTLKKMGEQIRKIREEKGLTLRDVSMNCNIDHSKIGKIEQGQVNITVTTLIDLAKGLAVDAGLILDLK